MTKPAWIIKADNDNARHAPQRGSLSAIAAYAVMWLCMFGIGFWWACR